jgi:nucleotide-binding universal stress UspA family protein
VKELVVGFDGSDLSQVALRWAAGLAGACGTRTVVFQAWSGGDPATAAQAGDEVKASLAQAATVVLGEQAANFEIEFEARRGSAAGTLLERVTPDSGLVLGSRGRGGFAGLLLGSVSRECIEHAPGPVIVVRQERALPTATAPILVGHDGSPSSAWALQWASDLARAIGAEVVAAHVWQTGSSEVRPRLHRRLSKGARQSVERWAKEVSPAIRPLELEGEPRMELVDLGQRLGASLLVVGRRGKGTVRALRIGSVASYLVTGSTIPIAIIPPAPGAEVS